MSGWRLFPHLVVRATGFAFDRLEGLRYEGASSAHRDWLKARALLDETRAKGPRVRRPSRGMLAALKAGRPVEAEGSEALEAYNRAARGVMEAEAVFTARFAAEEAKAQAALAALTAEPRFLEAVASSSPPVYLDLVRGRKGARLERQVASYLQRLCAKNETMSFFGPINYGALRESAPSGVSLTWSGPERLVGRNTFASAWLSAGIRRAVAFDREILPWLVLRRRAFATPPQGRRAGAESAEDALLARLLELADGTRPLLDLQHALSVAPEALWAAARLGCERGLLTHQLEVPAASHRPLADLAERLAGIPGPGARRHLVKLGAVLDAMARYSGSDAAGKVALNEQLGRQAREDWSLAPATPAPPREPPPPERRGESHNFYQDRLPLREECGGDLQLELGGVRAEELRTRLERLLGLMGEAAYRTREASREAVAKLVGARTVPFWKVVAAFSDRPVPYDHTISQAVAALVTEPSASRVDLSGATLPEVRREDPLPLITSVDLLVSARDTAAWADGDYELVMGDVHDTALVWGWALQFHPARAEVETQMVRMLGELPRPHPFVTVLASRRTGLLPSEFPGPLVELGSVSARASAWRLPFDDLAVESDGRTARLVSQRLRSEVSLYNGELESLVHTAFALPRIRPLRVRMGAHTPRVVLDGVVAQREQWQLKVEDCAELLAAKHDAARLRAALELWQRLALPDHVFAKFKDERKPILVDVQSPFLLRVFANLFEQKGEVFLSEMCPGPQGLWLRGPLGRHTSELRCTFVWSGG